MKHFFVGKSQAMLQQKEYDASSASLTSGAWSSRSIASLAHAVASTLLASARETSRRPPLPPARLLPLLGADLGGVRRPSSRLVSRPPCLTCDGAAVRMRKNTIKTRSVIVELGGGTCTGRFCFARGRFVLSVFSFCCQVFPVCLSWLHVMFLWGSPLWPVALAARCDLPRPLLVRIGRDTQRARNTTGRFRLRRWTHQCAPRTATVIPETRARARVRAAPSVSPLEVSPSARMVSGESKLS